MELLKFDEIFDDEDVSNYDLFIEKLKQLKEDGHKTRDILGLVYQYYKKYVTYNYDQLQIVKIMNAGNHPEIQSVLLKYPDSNITAENAEQLKQEKINGLNEAFMKLEGRPLTKIAIDSLFGEYGTVIHHEAMDYESFGKTKHKDAYDEIKGLNTKCLPAIYKNGMLQKGVCAEYPHFEKRICEDLEIKHMLVEGVGTTGHKWSLIYLPEEQRWGHFDMTMVKFYQDGWIKNHEPYTEQDWIAATSEDIFKMQPTRKITSINGRNCYFDKDNYGELDINKYCDAILPGDIGKATIGVSQEKKEEAYDSVSKDVKTQENQKEGVSLNGE